MISPVTLNFKSTKLKGGDKLESTTEKENPFKIFIATFAGFVLLSSIILTLVSVFFISDIYLKALILNLGDVCFVIAWCLGFFLVTIFPLELKREIKKIYKFIIKLIFLIITFVFFSLSIYGFSQFSMLLADYDDYQNENYETVIGYIENETVTDAHKYSRVSTYNILDTFEVNGVEIQGEYLKISETDFNEEVKGELVKVTYLPHSKLAVKWEFTNEVPSYVDDEDEYKEYDYDEDEDLNYHSPYDDDYDYDNRETNGSNTWSNLEDTLN